MNDFDTVNMNKFQKARYYLKEYGFTYTLDRALKKLGIPVSSDLEYAGWLHRRKPDYSGAPALSVRIFNESELENCARLPQIKEKLTIFQGKDTVLDPSFIAAIQKAASEHEEALLFYTDSDLCYKSKRFRPYFRPDYSPELLLTFPYIGEVFAVRTSVLKRLNDVFPFAGNFWYELTLHLSGILSEQEVYHISFPLWSKKVPKNFEGFYRPVSPVIKSCIENHLIRQGWEGTVEPVRGAEGFYEVNWKLEKEPLVSIIIPNKDHIEELSTCLDSLLKVNDYRNIEILIVENNSIEMLTFNYYASLLDKRIRVVNYEGDFNFSAINNLGALHARGEYLLLLNNDTKIIEPGSIRTLVAAAMRPKFAASGAMLYYPDNTIQHGGVVIKIGGFAANALWSLSDRDEKYYPYSVTKREMTACTAACLMVKKEVYDEINGFNEDLVVALNDVDLCLKIRRAGYKIMFCPDARLYHYESKSRGMEDNPEKQARFNKEIALFQETWQDTIDAGDPYYNVNQTLHYANYSLELAEDNRGRYKC